MRLSLCFILSFALTLSTWFEPSQLFAEGDPNASEELLWFYPYDPYENYLTVPWSTQTSNCIVIIFMSIGLGAIAGMIAGNVASKKRHKHHHGHHRSIHSPSFKMTF